jgi:transglutaminase-like putative cysteine protease
MMKRRDFMKTAALGTVACALPSLAVDTEVKSSWLTYDILWNIDISHQLNNNCKLWIPLPSEIKGFQKILQTTQNSDAREYSYNDNNLYGAKLLYLHWFKEQEAKKATVALKVALNDRQCDFNSKRICTESFKEAQKFLAPSAHIPIDGMVAKISKTIVGTQKDPLKKARKLYDWIIANSYRDENVQGCGVGSPNSMLAQLEREGRMGGKCLDMSALCVALMRASLIPAREVMGIRVGGSRLSHAFGAQEDITKSQHCKLEFFIDYLGWVPCDPADITKLVLKENLEKDSPRVREMADLFFGFWENNWMALNHARDFEITPKNDQGMLDSFGYIYGEAQGEYLDPFEPKSYRYSIFSVKTSV